jgi:MFS family permease
VGLIVPVLILLMQARGLDLAQAGQLMAVYGLVVIVLELPTGGLADTIGRRPVLAASSAFSALGSVVLGTATSPGLMLVAVLLLGAGRSLASGPLEAWYVDAVRRHDRDAEITSGIARAQAVEAVALGIGALVGGLLPGLVAPAWGGGAVSSSPVIPLSVPFLVSAAMLMVHAIAVVVLVVEPSRSAGRHGGSAGQASDGSPVPASGHHSADPRRATVVSTVAEGMRTALGTADLRRLIGYGAILGVAMGGVELISPVAFSALLGGPERAGAAYGLLVGLGFAAAALGAAIAPRVAGRFATDRAAATWIGLAAAPLMLLISAPVLGAAGGAFLALYLVMGVNGPVLAGLLHDRVDSGHRSTVLSVESLVMQVGGVAASLVVGGLVATTSTGLGYLVMALALAGGALLLRGITSRSEPVTPGSDGSVGVAPGGDPAPGDLDLPSELPAPGPAVPGTGGATWLGAHR